MNCASLTLTTAAQPLKTLEDRLPTEVAMLIIQSPTGNDTVYFGDSAVQPFELAAKEYKDVLPLRAPNGRINTKELYVKGTAGNKLSVAWIELNQTEL